MNNAKQVDAKITGWKADGLGRAEIAWRAALACVGWPYVFGARGEFCTVQNRHARYSDQHPTIRTACKGYDSGSCSGCKWYPGSERVRCYDCRGLTYWALKQVGVIINGAGATSQWNTEANWAKKGKVADGLPENTLVCLFVQKGKTMEHTGLGYGGESVEASNGVQHFAPMKAKWTHWAVPAGLYGDIPDPQPVTKPTLRKGSKGEWVTKAQTMLLNKGYKLPKYGADGSFGKETEAAVIAFQQDWGITADGVIGKKTWEMLESTLDKKTYTVTIRGLNKSDADALTAKYPGAVARAEGGES